jgi:hypothetical protein
MKRLSVTLVENIEDLSTKISSSSKRDPFFLYFGKEKVTERDFYFLCLSIGGYLRFADHLPEKGLEHHILEELYYQVHEVSRRFKECKFFKFFYHLVNTANNINSVMDEYLPSPREYLANYRSNPEKSLKRIFTLRFQTPRRIKRAEFRRGYRDHGSASSVSERARRQANQTLSESELSDMLYPELRSKNRPPLPLTFVESESVEYQLEDRLEP